jgi:MoaA/NifB/PqqE/SkfB family radical SAM enzyme
MYPKRIRLESCSLCQLDCPECPNASGKIAGFIGKNYLKFENFKKLVQLNPSIDEIELSNFGEIFLNPQLLEIIKYSNANGLKLRANNGTNLNTISDPILEALCKYNFQSITCSIDGATDQIYSKYRKRGSLDKVLDAITKINYYKTKHNTKFPNLIWQFIIFPHNFHHFKAARDMAKLLNMKFRYKLPWGNVSYSAALRDRIKRHTGLNTITRKEYFNSKGKLYYHQICYQLWKEIQINWDGKILGCCNNYWGSFGENSFLEPLANKLDESKLAYGKRMLLGKAEPKTGIPCTVCDIYRKMKKYSLWLDGTVANNTELICWKQ